ncbi:MAG: hypothetical protein LBN26_00365 [Christensenellaceae bacterium]|jgi:hypothetical protein|nr:hypothetical protein [Christensenellaceae bacterium]
MRKTSVITNAAAAHHQKGVAAPARPRQGDTTKKAVSLESFLFILLCAAFFGAVGHKMGGINMINTIMNTAYNLLISTVLYIMAIAVIAGALSELLSEFGVIALLNKLLSPLATPLFGLPGASIVGVFATYLSDNPAILTLAENKSFLRYFKTYQVPALTNLGTGFGMGLIVSTFMMSIAAPSGENFMLAVLMGNFGAIVGTVVSTRLMLRCTAREFGKDASAANGGAEQFDIINFRTTRKDGIGTRVIEALLDGGKTGVSMGLSIIPGVLVICTFVMMLTNTAPNGAFTGAAYEGIGFLPMLGEKIEFLLRPLFGFSSPAAISVPITALGAAGAAISLVPQMVQDGVAHANDIAVFTALCMCWSGYLSTHIAMMETLGYRRLAGKAILCHTIGGFVAGIIANWAFRLVAWLIAVV